MTDYMAFDSIAERMNEMDTDKERWEFVKDNPDALTIHLDNDLTYATCVGDDRDDPVIIDFDWYIGWADGLQYLSAAFGLDFECV